MPKNFKRTHRVSDVIHRTLANLITQDFKDPRIGMVTIAEVTLSPDLRHAKIYVTVLEENKIKETLKILNEASGYFRRELAHALKLRIVPVLTFIFDDSVLRGNRIAALLDKQDPHESP